MDDWYDDCSRGKLEELDVKQADCVGCRRIGVGLRDGERKMEYVSEGKIIDLDMNWIDESNSLALTCPAFPSALRILLSPSPNG